MVSLTGAFLVFMSIGLAAAFIILFFRKEKYRKNPFFVTYILAGLITVNWILYGSGFYTLFPVTGGAFFLPVWFVLCGWGFMGCLLESKNNTNAVAALGSLSLFSTLFGVFLQGLSRM
ncbi:hypothetical protein [Salibacterium lacus]|uniref:Uncharacterized protein n=1 Tax=Salibacterium lacus TaxID=1898109 RepID=A0ABW5T196_9BACI